MLWSLFKVVLLVLFAALGAWAAGFLQDTPGEVRIAFAGREISLTPLGFVLGLALLFGGLWLALRLLGLTFAILRLVAGDETAVSRYFARWRLRRGQGALTDALIAQAGGEGDRARKSIARAARLLDQPALVALMHARIDEDSGDRKSAIAQYKTLLGDERTRFAALRGLIRAKIAEGDHAVALKLAEKAHQMRPRLAPLRDELLDLQVRAGDWAGARRSLAARTTVQTLPREVLARRDAVLQLAEARAAHEDGRPEAARAAALAANRALPELVPAAVLAARHLAADGNTRAAVRILKKAWSANPHPDLGAAFAALVPDERPDQRLARCAPLLQLRPDHPESRLLETELHLLAEDFPAARRALGDLVDTAPGARVLALRAAVARGQGAPEVELRGWLARALSAGPSEAWVCDGCNHIHPRWVPVCANCAGLDTLSWRQPPASAASDLPETMLPLLSDTPAPPAPEIVPGAVPGAGHQAAPETAPETGPEFAPETTPDSTAGQAPRPRTGIRPDPARSAAMTPAKSATMARAAAPADYPVRPDDPGVDPDGEFGVGPGIRPGVGSRYHTDDDPGPDRTTVR